MVYPELDDEKKLLIWFLSYDKNFEIKNTAMTLGISPANWKPSDVELFWLLRLRLRGKKPEKIVRQMANLLIKYGYEVRNLTKPKKKCRGCGQRKKK